MTIELFADKEFHEKLLWMDQFVREEIYPLETLDLSWLQLLEAIEPLKDRAKAQGLWAAHLSPELGGQGFGQVKLGLMHEVLGKSVYGPPVSGNQAPDAGNSEILAEAGTEAQKNRWPKPLLSGEVYSAFALTEFDHAGSDPTRLTTTAVRNEKGWVINGHKWFITHASLADFIIVVATTDSEAPVHSRTSQFIVPADAAGVDGN